MLGETHGPTDPDTSKGYEVEDAGVREVLLTGVGLAAGTILVGLAVFGLMRVLQQAEVGGRQPVTELAVPPSIPPEPRLQDKPWEEMEAFRKREDQLLTTYGWTDRAAGQVRIPVDKAMELLIQRGLPARQQVQGTAPAKPTAAGAAQKGEARGAAARR